MDRNINVRPMHTRTTIINWEKAMRIARESRHQDRGRAAEALRFAGACRRAFIEDTLQEWGSIAAYVAARDSGPHAPAPYRIEVNRNKELIPLWHITMFNRADMSFYGFTAHDVIPPYGYRLEFPPPTMEPQFIRINQEEATTC